MAIHYDQFNPGSSSANPTSDRPIWRLIWDTKVPPKLKIFAWQVVSGSLPTDAEKKRRHFDLNGFCQVCDREQESSFHALLACPHAAALWDIMRLYWPLPDRSLINWTCKEWLLQLLDESQVSVRSRIIMVLWRSWYVRNEILHGKDPPPQDVSCSFLQSYHNTFSQISSSVEDIIKGKSPVDTDQISPPCKSAPRLPWPPPPDGMVALSVDGSYAISDGSAGAGMFLRTATGEVIFAAYRKLFHCNDALETELQAIREGVKLATERSDATIMIQSDCVTAINALTDVSLDSSAYGHMIREIKFLLSDRVFVPVKVSREQNRVADCLANYGRCGDSTACWLGHPPPFASDLVAKDCNSVIME
ncbi:retrotransposon unclassified [Hordeum vulgare]|nr:retrotransposon unclassified [Hordeum vulgare]